MEKSLSTKFCYNVPVDVFVLYSGCKTSSVTVVYTPFTNLKKTAGMDVGQVGFHDQKKVWLKSVLDPHTSYSYCSTVIKDVLSSYSFLVNASFTVFDARPCVVSQCISTNIIKIINEKIICGCKNLVAQTQLE